MEQQTVPKQRGTYLNPYVILMTRWMLIQLLDRATPELLDVFRCRSPKERLECIRAQK